MDKIYKPVLYYAMLVFVLYGFDVLADRITVHNKTLRDLYVAIYYDDGTSATRVEQPQFLETESSLSMDRPERKKNITFTSLFMDRELVFAEDVDILQEKLTSKDLKRLHSANIGSLKGSTFYITDFQGKFSGYTTLEWNVLRPALLATRKEIYSHLSAVKNNPYHGKIAYVRIGNGLCEDELAYLQVRKPLVKSAIEYLHGKQIPEEYVPKIALVCSGGGFRAMLYTTGCLVGAQEAGILDAVTYMVGLSGSTWALGSWLFQCTSIQEYHDWLVKQLDKGITDVSSDDARWISGSLLTKYFFDQPLGIVDLYGSLIANTLLHPFGKLVQQKHLSEQADFVRSGNVPFPIYTAIGAETIAAESNWYEFTPFEVGGSWLGMYVPSWALGRKFVSGYSVDFAPEQSFGFLMGTFGLAIGITIKRLVDEAGIAKKAPTYVSGFVKNIIERINAEMVIENIGQKRPIYAKVRNFTRGMVKSSRGTKKNLRMVDAGINFNVPYPPVSLDRPDRAADILIFIDASADGPVGSDANKVLGADVRKAHAYAKAKGYPFPDIDPKWRATQAVTIFTAPDPRAPIVIYIPRIVDSELFNALKADPEFAAYAPYLDNFNVEKCIQSQACNTFNFTYSETQSRKLTALGAFNMKAAQDAVKKAIARVVEIKSSNSKSKVQVAPAA